MPRVIINEIDRTQYNVTTNESDNIVYVPGAAITGPVDQAYLCRSLTEFQAMFGGYSPNYEETTMSAWEYACNLLLNGFPVLFRRIVGTYDSETDDYDLSHKASVVFADNSTPAVTQFTVTAIETGSTGNDVVITMVKPTYTIESDAVTVAGEIGIKINGVGEPLSITVGMTTTEVDEAFKAYLDGIESDLVKIVTETSFAINSDWFSTGTEPDKTYPLTGGVDPTEPEIMTWLGSNAEDVFKELRDKDIHDVKFLTLGGKYASTTDAETEATDKLAITELVKIAAVYRRDCLVLPDVPYTLDGDEIVNPSTKETYFDSIMEQFDTEGAGSSYATSVAPWLYLRVPLITVSASRNTAGEKLVPSSFIWLYELAKSLKNGNPIWLAPAGVNRASVPEAIKAYFEVGSIMAEEWQTAPRYINPIRKIRNYGYVIFGQKTLYKVDGTTDRRSAFQDLSVRITANEIKRKIRDISISLTFENNNLKTWNEFRAQLDPYLTSIAADGALENYKIIMDSTTTTDEDINNNTIRGTIIVQLARAAENFNIDFIVTNSSAEFEESY